MRFFAGLICFVLFLVSLGATDAQPVRYVQYQFEISGDSLANPFGREILVEVTRPDGSTFWQPAFAVDRNRFEVRVFPHQSGAYVFGRVREGGSEAAARSITPNQVSTAAEPDRFVRISPRDKLRFERGGVPYFPVGANLPWALGTVEEDYARNLQSFGEQRLNWARIWMAHWSGMNLDWVPVAQGAPVPLGELSFAVAARWDAIVRAAEENGVAFQLVLQHHGQVSRTVNPNWDDHPWNVRNGGFLQAPEEFFSDPRAIELTKRKYRYIVARWGYSPAIMAWELFNEVHFSAALRASPPQYAAVEQWHEVMAAHIRALDTEQHLVTTSYENLDGGVYSKMDYKQPHLYAAEMNLAAASLPTKGAAQDKPVFFGEIGDDQLQVTAQDRDSGESLLTPVWTSLMGDSAQMGQTWYVERLIRAGRLGQLGAVAGFIQAAGVPQRGALTTFDLRVQTEERAPLEFNGTLWWQHYPVQTVAARVDGGLDRSLAFLPRNVVAADSTNAKNFPDRARLYLDFPTAVEARIRLGRVTAAGAKARVIVDGQPVAEHRWTAPVSDADQRQGAELRVNLSPGARWLEVVNLEGDWLHLESLWFSATAPVLWALGKGNEEFVMAFVWHRLRFSGGPNPPPSAGKIEFPDRQAGRWRVTWWDTAKGEAGTIDEIDHPGGSLIVTTPAIDRHAAVFAEKIR